MTSLESIARERAEASGGQLLVLGIEDRQALVTLEQEIFPEDPWTTGMIAQELSSGRSVYFGVCVNDDAVAAPVLCGYAGIALGIDADVMTMGVLPDFRGRGLGRVLMDALIDVARRWGSERVSSRFASPMLLRFLSMRIPVLRSLVGQKATSATT